MEQEGKSTLLHLIRRFTIIDFLGYLIPGSIVTLSWNYRFNGILKAPFQDFFGEQTVLLTLYFLVLSYLVGTVIHEISKPLDLLVNKMLYRPLKEREALGNTKLYYKQIFPSPLRTGQESSGSVPRSSAASETTGNHIDFGYGRKFCVSVFRQTQEYRICNVHDRGLFPLMTAFPGGWTVCAPLAA